MSEEDNNNFDDNFDDEEFDDEDEDEFNDEDEGAKLYLTLRTPQTWELVRRTWGFPVTSSKDKPRFNNELGQEVHSANERVRWQADLWISRSLVSR